MSSYVIKTIFSKKHFVLFIRVIISQYISLAVNDIMNNDKALCSETNLVYFICS